MDDREALESTGPRLPRGRARDVFTKEVLPAAAVCAVSISIFYLSGKITHVLTGNRYVNEFLGQAVFAIAVFAGLALLKKTSVFHSDPVLLEKGWTSGLWYLFLLSTYLPACLAAEVRAAPWETTLYFLQVGMVGFCEECLFRGLLLNAFQELAGGNTLTGARLAVVWSGILFGALHLLNAINPGISVSAAAVQALGASWIGIYLGAIYVRTGKCLWFCILIHALNDLTAGIAAGTLGGVSVASVIESMGKPDLRAIPVLAAVYGLPAMIVLRRKKLQPVLDALNASRRSGRSDPADPAGA